MPIAMISGGRHGLWPHRPAVLALALAGLWFGACLPEAPDTLGEPPNLSGVWQGSITEDNIPPTTGTLSLTASHQSTSIYGAFTAVFPASSIVNSGTFTGILNDTQSAGTFSMDPSDTRFCPLHATISVLGWRIVGTYASFQNSVCISGTQTGSLDINKQ